MYFCLLLACSVGDSTPVELTPCGPHGQVSLGSACFNRLNTENFLIFFKSNYPKIFTIPYWNHCLQIGK